MLHSAAYFEKNATTEFKNVNIMTKYRLKSSFYRNPPINCMYKLTHISIWNEVN